MLLSLSITETFIQGFARHGFYPDSLAIHVKLLSFRELRLLKRYLSFIVFIFKYKYTGCVQVYHSRNTFGWLLPLYSKLFLIPLGAAIAENKFSLASGAYRTLFMYDDFHLLNRNVLDSLDGSNSECCHPRVFLANSMVSGLQKKGLKSEIIGILPIMPSPGIQAFISISCCFPLFACLDFWVVYFGQIC